MTAARSPRDRLLFACRWQTGGRVTEVLRPRPATGLDVRNGAAVHQLRAGVPLSEVQQQLGHARSDTTTISTKLTNRERRSYADRVEW